jgi:prepilin-type N-terminal cleavage/methylation domain-containing protein
MNSGQNGFTLIEQLVSLSLVVLLTVILSSFAADVLKGSARLGVYAEVQQNARLILDRIAQEVKTAEAIDASVPGRLSLAMPDGTVHRIDYDPSGMSVGMFDGTFDRLLSNGKIAVTAMTFQAVGHNLVEVTLAASQKGLSAVPGAAPYTWQTAAIMAPRLTVY